MKEKKVEEKRAPAPVSKFLHKVTWKLIFPKAKDWPELPKGWEKQSERILFIGSQTRVSELDLKAAEDVIKQRMGWITRPWTFEIISIVTVPYAGTPWNCLLAATTVPAKPVLEEDEEEEASNGDA